MWKASRWVHLREAKRRSRYYCRIDVTGFASVLVAILVLVIIFPARRSPMFAVDLPYSRYGAPAHFALREDAMTFQITRDGLVFFRGREALGEELVSAINAAAAKGAPRVVYLSVDGRVRYADVKPVIDRIRASGISEIVIITNREGQPPYVSPGK